MSQTESQTLKEKMDERQKQANGGPINITDLVFEMMKKNDSFGNFDVQLVSRTEAKDILRTTQIDILSNEFEKRFNPKHESLNNFREWMSRQSQLFDGCIVFEYCPHSMGISLHAKNTLTSESIDLTEY